METFWYLIVIVACMALSGFFSASETALLRVGQRELEQDIKAAHGPAALVVRELLGSTSRLLVTILLGNNVVNIMGAALASALAIRYWGDKVGIFVATGVMTVMVFVFCEVLPKAVAAQHPRRIAYAVALPLYLIHYLLRPLHLVYDRLVEPFVRSIAGGTERPPMSSSEEIMRLAREQLAGQPSGSPLAIIGAAAGAAEMTVSDIMVPRAEIVAFPVETKPSDLLDAVLEERYTRVPIYEGTIDKILGMAHLKDLVEIVRASHRDLRGILKPVLQVPERKPILRCMADMQRAFVHLAIVKDEFGVTLGMVTQEDILEELVGEIRDEFDREELLTIRKFDEQSYQALGRVKVLDFNRETSWKITAERGDTLAGLVFNALGHAPRRGEVVEVPGYRIVVADVSGNRVTQVRVIKQPDETGDAKAPEQP
ncbi:MAG: hemolysin family protein [Candidatus Binatia bacterium]